VTHLEPPEAWELPLAPPGSPLAFALGGDEFLGDGVHDNAQADDRFRELIGSRTCELIG
jgi:hypothetical protein